MLNDKAINGLLSSSPEKRYCESIGDSAMFSVFPTTENSYIVSAKQLMVDVNEHLDEVE